MNDLSIHVTVTREGGAREEMTVHAPAILVGSGAHCDIRLTGDRVAREHLLFELRGRSLFAVAKHMSPPPYAKGKPLFEAKLENGDEVAVAGTRIRVAAILAQEPAAKGRKRLALTALTSLALFALPIVAYAALRDPGEPPLAPPPAEIAPLFTDAPSSCPASSADQAEVLAGRLVETATLLREQHPFDVADGLAAVDTFERASSCSRTAGKERDAAVAASASEALRRDINDNYAARRVKLEHALDVDDRETALREVRALRRLVAGKRGAYVDWLGIVERRLTPGAPKEEFSGFPFG